MRVRRATELTVDRRGPEHVEGLCEIAGPMQHRHDRLPAAGIGWRLRPNPLVFVFVQRGQQAGLVVS